MARPVIPAHLRLTMFDWAREVLQARPDPADVVTASEVTNEVTVSEVTAGEATASEITALCCPCPCTTDFGGGPSITTHLASAAGVSAPSCPCTACIRTAYFGYRGRGAIPVVPIPVVPIPVVPIPVVPIPVVPMVNNHLATACTLTDNFGSTRARRRGRARGLVTVPVPVVTTNCTLMADFGSTRGRGRGVPVLPIPVVPGPMDTSHLGTVVARARRRARARGIVTVPVLPVLGAGGDTRVTPLVEGAAAPIFDVDNTTSAREASSIPPAAQARPPYSMEAYMNNRAVSILLGRYWG